VIACVGLYNHPGATRFQALSYVCCGPSRVAHVVQAVEERHEVVLFNAGVFLGGGNPERTPVLNSGFFGDLRAAAMEGSGLRWRARNPEGATEGYEEALELAREHGEARRTRSSPS
jgi:hypothetical protein